MLTKWLGTEAWITNLDLLTGLHQYASDPILQKEWNLVSPLSFLRN
jgi:starch phosphorylase